MFLGLRSNSLDYYKTISGSIEEFMNLMSILNLVKIATKSDESDTRQLEVSIRVYLALRSGTYYLRACLPFES